MGSSRNEQLTIGHVKQFSACTSNLDPYLRKLIKQYRKEQGMAEDVEGGRDEFIIKSRCDPLTQKDPFYRYTSLVDITIASDAIMGGTIGKSPQA